ncbi:hypothetical protein ACFLQN_00390 [Candidatus Aenigmatarchaeota archaeon]
MKFMIIAIAIASILIISGCTTQPNNNENNSPTNNCNYDDPHRNYISKDPERCAVMDFGCMPPSTGFDDECGCGCETIGDEIQCTEKEMDPACIAIYEPVCGYTGVGHSYNYPNECVACKMSAVFYYIPGECPE